MTIEKRITEFQNNLRMARKAAGLTAVKLGQMVGLTRQSVYNIEQGKTKMTKAQYIAFQVVLRYKLGGDDSNWLKQIIDD